MDAAQLRPLSIGEILDVSIKIYRERFVTLVKAVAVVVGPVSLLTALVQVSALPDAETFGTPIDSPVVTTPDFGDLWAFLAGILVVGLLGFVATQVATAASFKVVSGAYLDAAPGWQESLRFALSKLRSLMWLALLTGVLVGLGFLACIVPGVYLYGAWVAAVPVLLLEDRRGRRALGRSRELVSGRWWATVGALLAAIILAAIVQALISALLFAVVFSGQNEFVQAIAQALANTAGSVLTTPFTAAVVTVIYFDLRVRKEGFDVELLARRVGVKPPAVAPTDVGPPPTDAPPGPPPGWPPPSGWRPPDG